MLLGTQSQIKKKRRMSNKVCKLWNEYEPSLLYMFPSMQISLEAQSGDVKSLFPVNMLVLFHRWESLCNLGTISNIVSTLPDNKHI